MQSSRNIMASSSRDPGTLVPWSVTSSARFDFAASCVAFLVAVTIGAVIWKDITFFEPSMDIKAGDAIAVVSDMKNLVRRKSGTIPVWNAAAPQEILNAGDYVFTDRGSSTKLTFSDQGVVELGENTMIQVERTQENAALKLMQGSMRTAVHKDAKPLLVKLGKKGTLLKASPAAEVQIQTGKNGEARVAILQGSAELVEGTKTLAVGPSQAVAMTETGEVSAPKTIPLHLRAPTHEEIISVGRNGSVEFSWDGEDTAVMFELARDPQFKNIVFREEVSDDVLKIERPESGVHYWRVVPQGMEASFVETRRLYIAVNEPPALLWPENNAVVTRSAEKDVALLLLWRDQAESKVGFELELSQAQDFSSGVKKFSTNQTWFQVSSLEDGAYFWRVKKVGGADADWAAVWQFTVKEAVAQTVDDKKSATPGDVTHDAGDDAPLPPPDLNDEYEFEAPAKKDGAFLWEKILGMGTAYAADEGVQTIKWPAVANAQGYFVQIASDREFKHVVRESDASVAQYSFEGFKPGTYFLRIATLDRRKVQGAFSKPVRVVISYPAPRLVKPADGVKLIADEAVEFDWRKVDGAKSYRVEFAHDRAFKKIIRTESPALSSLSLKTMEPGSYFWRVIAVFPPDGASKPSTVRSVTMEQAKAPVVAAPPPQPALTPTAPGTPPPSPAVNPTPIPPMVTETKASDESALGRQQVGTIVVGAAPSSFRYTVEGSSADLDLNAKVFNSFFVQGRIPLPRRFEADVSVQRAATEMFREKKDDAQRPLKMQFLTASTGITYGLLGPGTVRDSWLGLRIGVQQQALLKFSRETMRTIAVEEVMALGPSLGFGGQVPLGKNYIASAYFSYAYLTAASLKRASSMVADFSFKHHLSAKMFLSYGVRSETARHSFKEAKDGNIKNDMLSMTFGLGRHL